MFLNVLIWNAARETEHIFKQNVFCFSSVLRRLSSGNLPGVWHHEWAILPAHHEVGQWRGRGESHTHTGIIMDSGSTGVMLGIVQREKLTELPPVPSPQVNRKKDVWHAVIKTKCSGPMPPGCVLLSSIFIVKYLPSYLNKCVLINTGRRTFSPLVAFMKQSRLRCFPLSFPRWFFSINLVVMDLISSMGLSGYTLCRSWHASH